MKWWNNIKRFLYLKKLRFDAKSKSKVPREMLNIKYAQKIGILFNATSADDIITVTKYAEGLKKEHKDISILAYQSKKDKDNKDPRFINELDINWFYIPTSEKINNFHKMKLDILICAFVDECLPLEYIAATSDAKFRVGDFSDAKSNYFELMINTKKNRNLKYLLEQIDHFLHVINP